MTTNLRQRMRTILLSCLIAGAVGLVSNRSICSAAEADSEVFFSLQSSIDNLLDLDLPNVGRLWSDMGDSARKLAGYSQEHPLPKDYAVNLKSQSEALTRVVKDEDLSNERKLGICNGVAKDLKIKVAVADKNKSNPFANILLAVKTTDGVKETNGCEVWYVPEAWKGTTEKHKRFPTLSSPTSKQIPPGYYLMWTARDNRNGKEKPVPVQEADGANQKVDLPAPASN